jgi:hypothetical protein
MHLAKMHLMQVDSVGGRRLEWTFQYIHVESKCLEFQLKTLGWLRIQSGRPIVCHICVLITVIRGDESLATKVISHGNQVGVFPGRKCAVGIG